MTDPRITKLADLLINYSCVLKPGEKVLLEAIDVPHAFTRAVVEAAAKAGGAAVVLLKSNEVNRALMLNGSEASWNLSADVERLQMENVQCYIGARGSHERVGAIRCPGRASRRFMKRRCGRKSTRKSA